MTTFQQAMPACRCEAPFARPSVVSNSAETWRACSISLGLPSRLARVLPSNTVKIRERRALTLKLLEAHGILVTDDAAPADVVASLAKAGVEVRLA